MWATAGAVATGCCFGAARCVGWSGSIGDGKQAPKQDAEPPGGGALARPVGFTTGATGFGDEVKG